MSGNYPDGVTGNEYEIAGPAASALQQRTCDALTSWVPTRTVRTLADTLLRQVRSGEGANLLTIFALQKMDEYEDAADEFPCGYDGEVELIYVGRDIVTWECPRCGTEHEESNDEDEL